MNTQSERGGEIEEERRRAIRDAKGSTGITEVGKAVAVRDARIKTTEERGNQEERSKKGSIGIKRKYERQKAERRKRKEKMESANKERIRKHR